MCERERQLYFSRCSPFSASFFTGTAHSGLTTHFSWAKQSFRVHLTISDRLGFPTFVLFSQFLRFLKGSQVKECVKVLRSFCISLSTLLHNIFSFIPARRNYKESHFVALRGINNMMLAGWLAAWASDKCCFHFEITIFHSVHTKKTSSAFCIRRDTWAEE